MIHTFRYEFAATSVEDLNNITNFVEALPAQIRSDELGINLPDVEIINITSTSTPPSGSSSVLLSKNEDRQTFIRKLNLGPAPNGLNRTSGTVKPATSTSTALPTIISTTSTPTTTTPKKRGYKYRPTYFYSTPTFGPPSLPVDQCLCPCSIATVAQFTYDPNFDPFEEQKLLFELSRAFNRSLLTPEEEDYETGSTDYPETRG